MVAPLNHQHVLDLAWVSERAARITHLMFTLGMAPSVEDLEDQRWEIASEVKAIERRFDKRLAYVIVKRIERVTGKLELPTGETDV